MKVFVALLAIVGFAAAAPSPKDIFKTLKDQLKQDVKDIQAHTQQAVDLVSKHSQEDVQAIIDNPFTGLQKVIKNLNTDAKNVISTAIADSNKVNEHIQTALNGLSEVDSAPFRQILSNLKNELKGDVKDMKATVQKLMKQALGHIGDDVKALLTDPQNASKIVKENWNTDFNQFLSEGKNYVATVQKQIQDAVDQINQLSGQ